MPQINRCPGCSRAVVPGETGCPFCGAPYLCPGGCGYAMADWANGACPVCHASYWPARSGPVIAGEARGRAGAAARLRQLAALAAQNRRIVVPGGAAVLAVLVVGLVHFLLSQGTEPPPPNGGGGAEQAAKSAAGQSVGNTHPPDSSRPPSSGGITILPGWLKPPPDWFKPPPAPTPAASKPPQVPASEPQQGCPLNKDDKYIVQPGEGLSVIAGRCKTTVPALAAVNGLTLTATLQTGQSLRIPSGGAPSGPSPTPRPVPVVASPTETSTATPSPVPPRATAAPTETPVPAEPTATPTATARPIATPRPWYPAPHSVQAKPESSGVGITWSWNYGGDLGKDEYFRLEVRRDDVLAFSDYVQQRSSRVPAAKLTPGHYRITVKVVNWQSVPRIEYPRSDIGRGEFDWQLPRP